jgi:hypothetical protein
MSVADLHLPLRRCLGVRPGESDPAGMLCRVLLLLAVIGLMAVLVLTWWVI